MIHLYRRPALLPLLALFLTLSSGPATADKIPIQEQTPAGARQKIATTILADIGQATWIAEGKGPHVVYIFFDPNCPACNQLHHALRPSVERGDVELRWIPVGILMLTSHGKAAALLEAKDRHAALQENKAKFNNATGFGGISEEPLPAETTVKQLDANAKLLKHTANMAVPTLVFRDKDNKATVIQGVPPAAHLERMIKELK